MKDLKTMTPKAMLKAYVAILGELKEREITQSQNAPTGGLAEHIFQKTFNWTLAANSEKGYDAKDDDGKRYQIKAKRVNSRDFDFRSFDFDFFAVILFTHDYEIDGAVLIPKSIVKRKTNVVKHTNVHRFRLSNEIWDMENVQDVTNKLRESWNEIGNKSPKGGK